MPKHYVLDTNVLLHDPSSLSKFEENPVYLPIAVIEEMDRFKKDMDETGRNARQTARILDDLRKLGQLNLGVELENEGMLTVVLFETAMMSRLPVELNESKADNRILAIALDVQSKHPDEQTILVTKDVNLRIKADAVGLKAEDYEHGKVAFDDLYTGVLEVYADPELVNRFHKNHALDPKDLGPEVELLPNQYITCISYSNPSHTFMGRYDAKKRLIVPLIEVKPKDIWDITPRNREQRFALDALLNDDVKIVSLVGKAGTGKTLIAIAAGLAKTADEGVYTRLLVSRPVFPMGRDLGFLPGDIEEKLSPWMQPIFDNVDLLLHVRDDEGNRSKGYRDLKEQGILEIEPLTYIRGRSIPKQYMIVDEAQNLTPHEIKTIVTRAGEGTKIILTGDPQQIDNPYVDASSNGLSYVVERLREQELSAHITLQKGERSALAELASNLL